MTVYPTKSALVTAARALTAATNDTSADGWRLASLGPPPIIVQDTGVASSGAGSGVLAPNSVATGNVIDGTLLRADMNVATLASIDRTRHSVTPTPGQTTFTLPSAPSNASTLSMTINGVAYRLADASPAFTLSGLTVSWTGAYSLAPSDVLTFEYA